MNRKVGILTRHCYPNYGSILQTYALQSALKKIGADPVVLDYVSKDDTPLGLVAANLRISKKGRSWIGVMIYALIQTPTFLSMFSVFRSHQKRLLKLSRRVQDRKGLSSVGADIDFAVAGSDQIWNRIIDSIDENYFLPFMKRRFQRFSYAASLGGTTPLAEDTDLVLNSAREMGAVSVREPSSARWISDNGIEARSDVDPVMLHDREFWKDFTKSKRTKKFEYILVYNLHVSSEFTMKLKKIQKHLGLPIIRLSPDWKHIIHPGKTKILESPEGFLSWIRDAKCVVTDSFHGTVFSLIFGRPIYVVPPGKYSTRLTDVLARVGLESSVYPRDEEQASLDIPTYDTAKVDELLKAEAGGSWEYLTGLVEGYQSEDR